MQTLPPGYRFRRPTLEDGPNVFAVVAASNTAAIGVPDYTPEDAAEELDEPNFDRDQDGWLVFTDAGDPAGWAWTELKTGSNNAEMQVYATPGHDEVMAWLWEMVQVRALEKVRLAGYADAVLDINIYPEDKRSLELAQQHGYEAAARFVRMRIDHDAISSAAGKAAMAGIADNPAPGPQLPEGVELRHGTESERVRRDALDVRNKAFFDHFGYVPKSFDEWVRERETSTLHDWGLVHVVYAEGQPAATLIRTNHFVSDENCGYVLTLGTAPEFQGRGLAGFLLRYAFAADAALGRVGTVLHVDSNPQRPALGLYQRAGMRQVLVIDGWRRSTQV